MSVDRSLEIASIIKEIEKKVPVKEWNFAGVDIWPLLRNRLFLFALYNSENGCNEAEETKIELSQTTKRNLLFKITNYCSIFFKFIYFTIKYKVWLSGLDKKEFLFVAPSSTRENLNGKKINKFFDPLIIKLKLQEKSCWVEFNETRDKKYIDISIGYEKGELFLGKSLFKLYNYYFQLLLVKTNLKGFELFEEIVCSHDLTKDFNKDFNVKSMRHFHLKKYIFKYNNALRVLKKISPKRVFVLDSYNESTTLLIAAANKLGCDVIEMQHGVVAEEHLAYCNWTNIPTSGYNSRPSMFWSWDKMSKSILDNSEGSKAQFTSFVGGHPWIDFWKNINENNNYCLDENYILFCMQIEPYFIITNKMVDFIKNTNYKCYFRFHPRQLKDIDLVIQKLKDLGVYDLVEIDKANNTPLPILLNNMKGHITPISSTTIEAALFGKLTILIDPLSIRFYKDIIDMGRAVYVNPNSDSFVDQFVRFVETYQDKDSEIPVITEEGKSLFC